MHGSMRLSAAARKQKPAEGCRREVDPPGKRAVYLMTSLFEAV